MSATTADVQTYTGKILGLTTTTVWSIVDYATGILHIQVMGSDDGNKRSHSSAFGFYSRITGVILQNKTGTTLNCKNAFVVGSIICVVTIYLLFSPSFNTRSIVNFFRMYLSPEYHLTKTFQRRRNMDYDYLPSHCQPIAKHFDDCQYRHVQQQPYNGPIGRKIRPFNPITPTITFACHRKWCDSYFGHCEPCSGLGDRYRFLVSQVHTLFSARRNEIKIKAPGRDDYSCYANLQIDAPTDGLQQIESSLYLDPTSWLGEFFHYRSYSVSKRELLPYNDILLQQSQHKQQQQNYYSHFTPNHYGVANDYNACYFHIIYKPDDQLQHDIEYHRNNILHSKSLPHVVDEYMDKAYTTIGIHYRTGDAVAFGIQNADERIDANQLISGWNKMYDCSISLMKQLLLQKENYENVRFYLATDNPTVKEYVRQHHSHDSNSSTLVSSLSVLPFIPVYVTDLEPDSYLRGNSGDRSALLELYLLSGCDGIVVNALPTSGYNGTAAATSQFAGFAKKIGFLPNTNYYKCTIH